MGDLIEVDLRSQQLTEDAAGYRTWQTQIKTRQWPAEKTARV